VVRQAVKDGFRNWQASAADRRCTGYGPDACVGARAVIEDGKSSKKRKTLAVLERRERWAFSLDRVGSMAMSAHQAADVHTAEDGTSLWTCSIER